MPLYEAVNSEHGHRKTYAALIAKLKLIVIYLDM